MLVSSYVYGCICTDLIAIAIVTKDVPAGTPNLQVYNSSGELVTEYIQKKQHGWLVHPLEYIMYSCSTLMLQVSTVD